MPRKHATLIVAAHRVAEVQLLIAYEFVIKPILVRVCGESVFGLNYNNSLSLWNFDEYFLKCRVWTTQAG